MNADTAADGSDLQVTLAAAEAGAAVLGSMYGTELEHPAKSATDFATAADVAAELDPGHPSVGAASSR